VADRRARSGPIPSKYVLLALCGTVFVDLLGFTIVLPSLPFHVAALGGSGAWLGVVLTGYSLAQAVAAPLLGRLADRHGRRRLLLLSLLGSAASLALMGAAGTLWLLIFARLVAGACGGSIGVAQAFAVDLAGPTGRAKAVGMVGASVGLAFTIGPALGALAAPLGFSVIAWIAAGLAAANLVLAFLVLPATQRPASATPQPAARRRALAPWPLLISGFASMAAFVGMETTLAFLAEQRFGAGPSFVGWLLCGAGLCLVVVQGFVVAPAVKRWGESHVAVTGALLTAAGLAAAPFLPQLGFVAAVLLLSAGNGLVTASVASWLAGAGPAEERGARMGQGQSAAAAARVVGPLQAGLLFDLTAWVPYLVGTALSVTSAAVLGLAGKPPTDEAQHAAERPAPKRTTDRNR
jgi:predicted MFS family arabinose efflux permease